jgi:nucleoside-diphosphate-sugar epimerase
LAPCTARLPSGPFRKIRVIHPILHAVGAEDIGLGDGLNRWPAVHRLDAARLYRLALEKGLAGARYHGVADAGVPFREIVEVIGRRLNVQVVSKSAGEAADHFGWIANFVSVDCPASNDATQQHLE